MPSSLQQYHGKIITLNSKTGRADFYRRKMRLIRDRLVVVVVVVGMVVMVLYYTCIDF